MNWHFKKNSEINGIIEVGYSFEQNETCDGIIIYEKSSKKPVIKKLSNGSSLGVAQRGSRFLHCLIGEDKLTERVFNVRTG